MFRFGSTLRRLLAPLLTATMLLTAAVVPILDRYAEAGTTVAPAGEQTTAVVAHDHSICIQVSANQGLLTQGARDRFPEIETADVTLPPVRQVPDRHQAPGYLSRAPPLV